MQLSMLLVRHLKLYAFQYKQMSFDTQKSINRYNGAKLTKHVALSTQNRNASGVPNLQKLREQLLNNSHELNSPKKLKDFQWKQPNTNNLESHRLSTNKRKKLRLDYQTLNIERFQLPSIYQRNSHKKSVIKQEGKNPNTMRDEHSNLLQEIEDHLKPKPKHKNSKKAKELSFTIRTKAGLNGKNIKINQDIDIVDQKLPHGLKLFCVCDGHGINGHHVAGFIKKKLICTFILIKKENLKKDLKVIEPQFIQQQIFLVFEKTNAQLLQSSINTELSGSTVVAIFLYENRVFSFNVGDSRAIFINFSQNQWNYTALSNDHKPDRQSQARKIIAHGGRIAAQTNNQGEQIGPLRVWMKDVKSPGLAMTRSFGDKMGIKAGTSGEPEVLEFTVKMKNKFLLVASDGIWEHFQNYEIVKLLSPYLKDSGIEEAADCLMQKCLQIWNQNYLSRDDITFILVKINDLEASDHE